VRPATRSSRPAWVQKTEAAGFMQFFMGDLQHVNHHEKDRLGRSDDAFELLVRHFQYFYCAFQNIVLDRDFLNCYDSRNDNLFGIKNKAKNETKRVMKVYCINPEVIDIVSFQGGRIPTDADIDATTTFSLGELP